MVEIIPKATSKTSKGLSIVLYVAIFLLLAAVAIFFILNNFLAKAGEESNSLKAEISQIMTPDKVELEQGILSSKVKIDRFVNLIDRHLFSSKVFEIIEKSTHPQVWFTEFDLDSREKTIALSGETQSFETLGQQIFIMRNEEAISSVELEDLTINADGRVEFNISLTLKSNAF